MINPEYAPQEQVLSQCDRCGEPIPRKKGLNYCGPCFKKLTKEGFLL